MPQQKRLLILDDETHVSHAMARLAELDGFEVRTTTSPQEMFRRVKEWLPSHLAIDLVMPTMDGMEVLRELAGTDCAASIIVMSGMGIKVLESAQRSATESGLNVAGVLPKPFRNATLRELLKVREMRTSRLANLDAAKDYAITEDDLYGALRSNQFVLHYQPKIQLADCQLAGFEALVRWQHPTYGLLLPEYFIPLAEKFGVIDPMTYAIFDMGLAWLKRAEESLELSLAVNFSALSFTDVDLTDRLQKACLNLQIDPCRIIMELTEASAMKESAVAFDVLTRLRIKGFSLGMDDFGTGYSSMVQLAHLPFSEIKIDRSFVTSMHKSAESMTLVAHTISLGRQLGLTTVAEGVEDAETMRTLRALGCDQAQGYYLGRPMSGDDARKFVANWDSSRCA